MDKHADGIRNKIKNKKQVNDGNEYGNTLSPFRSIQQEFEQSSSYTEDLNSLEVGFSFQNEINDDIIATFGHGVVSDAIADPRFISESSDRYPELTRIAEDYFKKYQGTAVTDPTYNGGAPTIIEKEYDYNRLIKFYETSLFKAIKNYVPARTSLSTGIIVKQHLLERNKATTVPGININTPIAKTPETGSDVYGYTDQTGFNSVISQRNLLITSSIPVGSLTGSAGGSVNKYNVITNEGRFYTSEGDNITLTNGAAAVPLFSDRPNVVSQVENGIFVDVDYEGKVYFEADGAFISQVRLNMIFTGVPSSATDVKLEVTSSKRGGIFETTYAGITVQDPPGLISDNYLEAYPDERLYWNIAGTGATVEISAFTFSFGDDIEFFKPEPLSSQQVNWYIDDFTGEYKVDDHQTEFYSGEFSGSSFEVIPSQYNPYRIYVDGNNITRDQLAIGLPVSQPTFNFSTGTFNSTRFPSTTATTLTSVPIRATASLVGANNGVTIVGGNISGSWNGSTAIPKSRDAFLFRQMGGGTTINKRLNFISSNGHERDYVNIGSGNALYTTGNANGKLLLQKDINGTAIDLTTKATVSGGSGIADGIYSAIVFSRVGDTGNPLTFTGTLTVLSQIIGPFAIVNNNTSGVNNSKWVEVGDQFSGTVGGQTVTVDITSAGLTNGLLAVQFMNSGTSLNAAANFATVLGDTTNGHGAYVIATVLTDVGNSGNLGAV